MATAQTTDTSVRVVVVDDDEDTRLWFKDVLQPANNFNVAGSFSNAAEALKGIPPLRPDLTLMDIRLPGLNGIECTKRLKQAMPNMKIIMVTSTHDESCINASLQAGATTFLFKPVESDQLLATLRFAANSQSESKANFESGKRRSVSLKACRACLLLSRREKEVLASLAEGLLYKEISLKLGVSYASIHKYQHNIFKKLRVSNRSEAIRIWFEGRNQP